MLEQERDIQLLSTLLITKAMLLDRNSSAEVEAYNKVLHQYYKAISGNEIKKEDTPTMANDLMVLQKLIGKVDGKKQSGESSKALTFGVGAVYKGEVSNMKGKDFVKTLGK